MERVSPQAAPRERAVELWARSREAKETKRPGVECQVVAIPCVDGAKFQVADDIAYGCIGRGSWGYVVTEG